MFSAPGMSARVIRLNNESLEAIRNVPTPQNASEVRSFRSSPVSSAFYSRLFHLSLSSV